MSQEEVKQERVLRSLWTHQAKACAVARERGSLFILYGLGSGKTGTAISIIRDRFNMERMFISTLILAPLSILQQWKREFWHFSKIPMERIVVLEGNGEKRQRILMEARAKMGDGIIVIVNYESSRIEELWSEIVSWGPKIVICDESHRLKSSTTLAFKQIMRLIYKADYRYLLTGTPVLKNPLDLFAQFMFLDGGETFGTNFFVFRSRYFFDKNAGMPKQRYFPNWQVKPGSLEVFNRLMQQRAVQARTEDCVDLPPLIEPMLEAPLGADQKKAYEQMRDEFIAFVKDKQSSAPIAVVANFAITKSIRLQQILAGFVVPESEEEHPERHQPIWFKDVPRLRLLEEVLTQIRDSGEKVILWTDFVATYPKFVEICNTLEMKHSLVTGQQNAKEKHESIQAFREGDAQVLISNPKAGGTGLDLYMAKHAIFYTRPYSSGDFWQAQGRNYRGGSNMHDRVIHHHIYSPGTLDEKILQALKQKKDVAEAILSFSDE